MNEVSDHTAPSFEQAGSSDLCPAHTAPEQEPNGSLPELRKQVQILTQQLAEERQLNRKLRALYQFNSEAGSLTDHEQMSQRMAQILQSLTHCDLACIFRFNAVEHRLQLVASAGPAASLVPASFLPEPSTTVDLAIRLHRVIASQKLEESAPPVLFGARSFPDSIAAPLMRQNELCGVLLLADHRGALFTPHDATVVETAAAQLLSVWDLIQKNQSLTEFVQSITTMSIVQEAGSLMEIIASIARRTLNAMYTVVATLNQKEWAMRSSGNYPKLFQSLQNEASAFLEAAIKSPYTFRLRDLRNDERSALIQLDSDNLRSLLACPIRTDGVTTGMLLAFGKLGEEAFSDNDVFMAELLAAQAGVNLESCFLNQEVRNNLKITQLLYDLSLHISQAEDLNVAAYVIARTAYRLLHAQKCGLILFSSDGRKEAEIRFPSNDSGIVHPYGLIQQAMDSRQMIFLSESETTSKVAIPIQTPRRCYGALWVEIVEGPEETRHPTEEIRILVNQAAVALERSILLEETRRQAGELVRSFHRLEQSYDQTLKALMRATDARDHETEGHSERVTALAVQLGMEMGLSKSELKAIERGALLHDIGKIGISDSVLLKPGPLDNSEWETMRKHPEIGALIIQEIPSLQDALPVIAFHQERWDGSGYPLRLSGKDIPLLARIFAVVDVFDALTSDRPYRDRMPVQDALEYIESQAGIQFDPEVVEKFSQLIRSGHL